MTPVATYEEAVEAAKAIVLADFKHLWEPGMTEAELITQYCFYGEDPMIVADGPGDYEHFSSRTYASSMLKEFCEKKNERKKSDPSKS